MRASRAGQDTEASAEHTSPFCVRKETPQDSSPFHRRKCVQFVQKRPVLMQNMYPLSNQTLPPNTDLPKNAICCTPYATPKRRARDCQRTNTDAEHVSTVEPSVASRANAKSPEESIRTPHATPRHRALDCQCFSRFLCLPLVCAVSVLHILCLWWLKLSSQWKSTHWVQGFVTSCFCLVFDASTVVAEHGSGTESGGVTAT